jgi:hypothetical protein
MSPILVWGLPDLEYWHIPTHTDMGKNIRKKSARKIKMVTFTNRFDNHKSNWALSDKYQSDAKWFRKHNDIIHFCLNLIAAKAFISRRWRTILKSWSVLFVFFIPQKCQVLVSTLTVLFVVGKWKKITFYKRIYIRHRLKKNVPNWSSVNKNIGDLLRVITASRMYRVYVGIKNQNLKYQNA